MERFKGKVLDTKRCYYTHTQRRDDCDLRWWIAAPCNTASSGPRWSRLCRWQDPTTALCIPGRQWQIESFRQVNLVRGLAIRWLLQRASNSTSSASSKLNSAELFSWPQMDLDVTYCVFSVISSCSIIGLGWSSDLTGPYKWNCGSPSFLRWIESNQTRPGRVAKTVDCIPGKFIDSASD